MNFLTIASWAAFFYRIAHLYFLCLLGNFCIPWLLRSIFNYNKFICYLLSIAIIILKSINGQYLILLIIWKHLFRFYSMGALYALKYFIFNQSSVYFAHNYPLLIILLINLMLSWLFIHKLVKIISG